MMNVLFVGGKFDLNGGRPSGLVTKFAKALEPYVVLKVHNGGDFSHLEQLLSSSPNFDVILWWPDVPKDLPRLRDVKSVAPHSILVSSKNNLGVPASDGTYYAPYSAAGLVAKALAIKANLTVVFEGSDGHPPYCMKLMDPLGNVHSDTTFDVNELAVALVRRLNFLNALTRVQSRPTGESATLPPDDPEFFQAVRRAAEDFHRLLDPGSDVQRLLGNASFRCANGFPAMRKGGDIFVSKRNVDKRDISRESFVQVYSSKTLLYYDGDHKPSVDAPIQARLFEAFPRINYMLHGHVYIPDCYVHSRMTSLAFPCGALEELLEIIPMLKPDCEFAGINLRGHGCLIMASEVRSLRRLDFKARPVYERV